MAWLPETLECGSTQELLFSRPMVPPDSWNVWRSTLFIGGEVTSRIRITVCALPQFTPSRLRNIARRASIVRMPSHDVAHQRPDVRPPQPPHADLRHAPTALELVARNLHDAAAALQCAHQHFLLDGRQIRREPERARGILAQRAKSVLAVGQPDLPPVVDGEHDELRTDIAEQLLGGAVKLVAAAARAGRNDEL